MKNKIILGIGVLLLIIIAGYVVVKKGERDTLDNEGNRVSDQEEFFNTNENKENVSNDKKVLTTNGVKHTVPLDDIRGGGPPKDGIPSIDNPKFVSVSEANEFLNDEGIGIAVSHDGVHRFYPNQILVWHEIVNDTLNGKPFLITYCPLCATGIVFDPIVNGEASEFGTSGKLWNSNLVMYDRNSETYWSQVLGEGILGEHAGEKLALLPYKNIRYLDWKSEYPDGEVLSKDTGHFRDYTRDPYGDYYTTPGTYFPVDNTDSRYHDKEITYGIEIDDKFKAYPESELKKISSINDSFAGKEINLEYNESNNTVIFVDSSTGEEIIPVYGFWFSWIAVHPNSEVFTAK